jgi:hypothetical protein
MSPGVALLWQKVDGAFDGEVRDLRGVERDRGVGPGLHVVSRVERREKSLLGAVGFLKQVLPGVAVSVVTADQAVDLV